MKKLVGILMVLLLVAGTAVAEKVTEAWVMCNPASEVNLRSRANKHSDVVARLCAGERLTLTGRKIGRWYQVRYPCEAGEGWVRGDYLSMTEPKMFPEGELYETTHGSLYARYSIRGNKCAKLKKGVIVKVYLMAEEWSVTSRGYIMTKYLTEVEI